LDSLDPLIPGLNPLHWSNDIAVSIDNIHDGIGRGRITGGVILVMLNAFHTLSISGLNACRLRETVGGVWSSRGPIRHGQAWHILGKKKLFRARVLRILGTQLLASLLLEKSTHRPPYLLLPFGLRLS
jgi:hypothetical protein